MMQALGLSAHTMPIDAGGEAEPPTRVVIHTEDLPRSVLQRAHVALEVRAFYFLQDDAALRTAAWQGGLVPNVHYSMLGVAAPPLPVHTREPRVSDVHVYRYAVRRGRQLCASWRRSTASAGRAPLCWHVT